MQDAQFALHADIEERHWWFVARRRIMQALVHEVLIPSRQSVVVDIGCGTGANIASLSEEYRCVGIDTSAAGVALARQRFPRVEFLEGFAPQDLGPIAGQADLYLVMDVLEHVPDDFQLLSHLLAAAKPGCHFLITVPAHLALWSEHDESFGHYRRYQRSRLAQVWEGLPVTTRLLSYYNSRLYPIIKGSRTISRWRGKAAGVAGTDFWIPRPPANAILTSLFAGEASRLVRIVRGHRKRGYPTGVSLVALLRRESGHIEPRTRPPEIAADYFDPVAGRYLQQS